MVCMSTEQIPTAPVPTVGRIVLYKLTEYDASAVNKRVKDAMENMASYQARSNGTIVYVGNSVSAGDVYPMIVVRVWTDDLVNGQVMLDGNYTLWVTSVHVGEDPGNFAWPVRA
jgi:hypothetical protein